MMTVYVMIYRRVAAIMASLIFAMVVPMNSDAVTHLAALCSLHSCGSARRGQAVSMSAVRHSKLGSSTSVADFRNVRLMSALGQKQTFRETQAMVRPATILIAVQ